MDVGEFEKGQIDAFDIHGTVLSGLFIILDCRSEANPPDEGSPNMRFLRGVGIAPEAP
jgi:hypothetical protein